MGYHYSGHGSIGDCKYKDSIFSGEYCDWREKNARITGISEAAEDLYFPEQCNGKPVTSIWIDPENYHKKSFPGVRRIHIPASVEELKFANSMFPNLAEVTVADQNLTFTTDGRLIYSNSGKSLCLCPVNGTGELAIPPGVRKLEEFSLAYTDYEEIRFPAASGLVVHEDALRGSRWLQKQTGSVVLGDFLYRCVPDEKGNLVIPGSTRRFRRNVFYEWIQETKNWDYKLCSIQCRVLPSVSFMEELSNYTSGTKLAVTSVRSRLDRSRLRELKGISWIEVLPGHKRYRTVDGVLFSGDGKTLLYYPPDRRQSSYQIPEGTVQIGAMAFAFHNYLQKLEMPDTVKKSAMPRFSAALRCETCAFPKICGSFRIPASIRRAAFLSSAGISFIPLG